MTEVPRANQFEEESSWVVGHLDHVCLLLWTGQPTIDGVQAMGRGLGRLRRKHATVSLLTFVSRDVGTHPMDIGPKKELIKVLKRHDNVLERSAIAVEGGGIRAAMARSAVTAVDMLVRPNYQNRVFSSLPRASVWLCDHNKLEWGELVDSVYHLLSDRKIETGINEIAKLDDGATSAFG